MRTIGSDIDFVEWMEEQAGEVDEQRRLKRRYDPVERARFEEEMEREYRAARARVEAGRRRRAQEAAAAGGGQGCRIVEFPGAQAGE